MPEGRTPPSAVCATHALSVKCSRVGHQTSQSWSAQLQREKDCPHVHEVHCKLSSHAPLERRETRRETRLETMHGDSKRTVFICELSHGVDDRLRQRQ
mmetsp:Transcript_25272/g.62649  ORF Transcript_25272/g.62649 Transcript_25272/m.62649 type:complete len:98 (+) Transcript_25272:53-346(+)